MNTALLTRLAIPLLALFGVAIAIHNFWVADGFFLNSATELLGILITIFYVNWILKKRDQQRWLPTDKRIAQRLRVLLNATISGLRDGLGFATDLLDEPLPATFDEYKIHKELMRIGEHVISPSALSHVQALDKNGWAKLSRHIQNSHNGVLTFLKVFQPRLTPGQFSDLLDLEKSLANSLTSYIIFPHIMGVPKDELPQTKTSPEILQQSGCKSTAEELIKICTLAKKLSESINRNDDVGGNAGK